QPGSALRFAWDLDGDGVFGETGPAAAAGDEVGPNPLFSAAALDGPTVRTIRLRVTGDAGLTTFAQTTVTVADAPPRPVSLGAPARRPKGQALVLTGQATDFSAADTAAGFAFLWQVVNGAGLLVAAGSTPTLTFTPQDGGTYTATLTVTDKDGVAGLVSQAISVPNAVPVLSPGTSRTLGVGDALSATGFFADPDADTWSARVDYGDGSGPQPLALNTDKSFHLDNVYNTAANFLVTVTVTDREGASGSSTLAVNVLTAAEFHSLLA